jgi:hypothetical protein|uniref:Uncharacterized protein n=1 Tax=Picea glauca TaxID=3330 RepID=A0A101LZG3_PICGL|nr:hypothetical protein ABT39_MTgene5203 [Picea glauca]QHR91182.1 hypothetical protein Q903MT_gene5214 [Picea sitchensis]
MGQFYKLRKAIGIHCESPLPNRLGGIPIPYIIRDVPYLTLTGAKPNLTRVIEPAWAFVYTEWKVEVYPIAIQNRPGQDRGKVGSTPLG